MTPAERRRTADSITDDELDALYARIAEAEAVIARVQARHRPLTGYSRLIPVICAECSAADDHGSTDNSPVSHPCPTITDLDPPKEPTS